MGNSHYPLAVAAGATAAAVALTPTHITLHLYYAVLNRHNRIRCAATGSVQTAAGCWLSGSKQERPQEFVEAVQHAPQYVRKNGHNSMACQSHHILITV
jgi:hypothetical protein